MASSMTLEGFQDLNRKLVGLEVKLAKKIVRTATRKATKPILTQVKSNAKSMIGGRMGALIAKNAKIIVFKHQRKGSYGLQIGMKPGVQQFDYWPKGASSNLTNRKSSGKKSYIPAAIEFGHDNAKPIPYIRRAWDAKKKLAVRILGRELKQGIEKAVRI